MKVRSYRDYLTISANHIRDKRKHCQHGYYDEEVYYKRCLVCGAFIAFRNPEDIKRRGEICTDAELSEEEKFAHAKHQAITEDSLQKETA